MQRPPKGQYYENGRWHDREDDELELDGEVEVVSTATDIWSNEVVVFARGEGHVWEDARWPATGLNVIFRANWRPLHAF